MKKIAILTHPIHTNYGGILQAFALQKTLKILGYDSDIIIHTFTCFHFKLYRKTNISKLLSFFYRFLKKLPTDEVDIPPYFQKCAHQTFIRRFLTLTDLYKPESINQIKETYRQWIVGSDQVWRLLYTKGLGSGIPFFFLGFLPEEIRENSFSYAASFGSDHWEGTKEETAQVIPLLQQFRAVSVREHSGVDICKQDLRRDDAVQMPDPTLLLPIESYREVIDSEKSDKDRDAYFASYILDSSSSINELLSYTETEFHLPHISLMPQADGKTLKSRLPISIPRWLRSIRNAEYLITDSFHGCVFAIIFNIPFICLGNKSRGTARFQSLLRTFNLEDRLLVNPDTDTVIRALQMPIHWEDVNRIHELERQRGISFLKRHLVQ